MWGKAGEQTLSTEEGRVQVLNDVKKHSREY
jgi:hypothetical protein